MRNLIFFFLLFVFLPVRAQGVYTSLPDPVYPFLQEMTLKTGLAYNDVIRPKTRFDIAHVLVALELKKNLFTAPEADRLELFLEEYASEIKIITGKDFSSERWRSFKYSDSEFSIRAEPIIGLQLNSIYGELQRLRYSGARVFGSWGEHFGFQMDFRDYQETGKNLDTLKLFTAGTGVQLIGGSPDAREFSEVRGSISFESKKIKISLGKDFMNWGSGVNSRIILSSKAPSFPHIRLEVKPVEWVSFIYFHAWLNSRVADSPSIYRTQINDENDPTLPVNRVSERIKFMASHMLMFNIFDNLSLSLGESVVYSDNGPQLGFFIPVLFWRLVDHYYEGQNGRGKGSNSQLFSDVVWKLKGYGQIQLSTFIDELSISQFFDKDNHRNQFGFTLGTVMYSPVLPNSVIRAEYTRLNPWVYSNFIQTQTYTNSGYPMGHYLGQNAEQFFVRTDYYFRHNLSASFSFEYNKRGGMDSTIYQYRYPSKEFMYGKIRKDVVIGAELCYEYMPAIQATLSFKMTDITDEMEQRTPSFMLGKNTSVSLGFSYNY